MKELEWRKTLGVSAAAGTEEIKDAYRRLAKKYHPDSAGSRSHTVEFVKITEAYRNLTTHAPKAKVIDFPVRSTRPAADPFRKPQSPAESVRQPHSSRTAKPARTADPVRTARAFGIKQTPAPGKPPQTDRDTDIPALGKLLETGRQVGIRAFAARSLGNSGKKSAYAYLRKGLYDPDEIVVRSTIEAIGQLRIRQSVGELGSAFARGNASIRCSILAAVERIGLSEVCKPILLAGMRDSDPEVRSRSLRLFARTALCQRRPELPGNNSGKTARSAFPP